MTWPHLQAFVWLRWRLAVNQIRRSGPGGAAVAVLFTSLLAAGGIVTLLAGFIVGLVPLATASPRAIMAVWDGAIVGFMFFWMIGLLTELQHSDALSLDRFLHLPVSPSSAFLINYVGSAVTLSLAIFLPAMLGLAAGLTLSRGPAMLSLFPLVAAFFVMMTAVTHQFRGWLASMMANPRRRRTIAAVVPLLFVLAVQLPNIMNWIGPGATARREAQAEARKLREALAAELAAGHITQEEYDRRRAAARDTREDADADAGYSTARAINKVAPPGWLAWGAEAAAEDRMWPPLAGVLGMGLIGALSLRRSYLTTIRLYQGGLDTSHGPRRPRVKSGPRAAAATGGRPRLLERQLPWTSDTVAAVALAGFRSAFRAPEIKMAVLVTPVFMLLVFTGMFRGQESTPGLMRALRGAGFAAFVMVVSLGGPAGNQFGFDRGAFRAFVLSPISRRDLLVGKNLSLFPLALPGMLLSVAVTQWVSPMRLDHLAGVLVQMVPLYLVFCLAANLLSIFGPITLKPGSAMPAPHQGVRSFYPLIFMLLIPLPVALTFIPLGVEALLSVTGTAQIPAYLVMGILQALVTVWVYRLMVRPQGELLQRREQEILEIVAARAG